MSNPVADAVVGAVASYGANYLLNHLPRFRSKSSKYLSGKKHKGAPTDVLIANKYLRAGRYSKGVDFNTNSAVVNSAKRLYTGIRKNSSKSTKQMLAYLKNVRRKRKRYFKKLANRYSKSKKFRKQFGIPRLVNRPVTNVSSNVKYKASNTIDLPPPSLLFYPTQIGTYCEFNDSADKEVNAVIANGFYRFDCIYMNVPPYSWNSDFKQYSSVPFFWLVYLDQDQWYHLASADDSPRVLSLWCVAPPSPSEVKDTLEKYKFVKIKNIRVRIYITHPYNNASVSNSFNKGMQGNLDNPGSMVTLCSQGSSSQRMKLYCSHFKNEINIASLTNKANTPTATSYKVIDPLFANPDDVFGFANSFITAADRNQILPPEDAVVGDPNIYSSSQYRHNRILRCSPKLRNIKYNVLSNQFKPFYGNSMKTYGDENKNVYAFPSKVVTDYYHYTLMYIPGEVSVCTVPVKPVSFKDGINSNWLDVENAELRIVKECPFKAVPLQLGLPMLNKDAIDNVLPPYAVEKDPALKISVTYTFIAWGPRSGNLTADAANGVSIEVQDGVLSDPQEVVIDPTQEEIEENPVVEVVKEDS
uniref:Capsid protein n=1 Tax=Cressdnaviricota sp. TaxID=2748378 RepID=A0A6M4B6C6_9VIRU|nr:capsid protein [Cressdnaviricota sp.]